jgi:DNA-binding SARP family transcriptional activator
VPDTGRADTPSEDLSDPTLRLLGTCELSIGSCTITPSGGAQRVLALVALKGPQPRSFLAGTLWPDTTDDQAAKRLRSTLWRLRHQLRGLVEVDEQRVGLSPALKVDVDELARVCRELIDGAVTASRLTACCSILVHARELLLGCYDDWVLQARERLANLRLHAMEVLADALIANGRFAEAVEVAIAAVHLDPLRESTHRALMRAYLAEGNPASARCELERYRHLLHAELGIDEPTPLMDQLLRDSLAERSAVPAAPVLPRR